MAGAADPDEEVARNQFAKEHSLDQGHDEAEADEQEDGQDGEAVVKIVSPLAADEDEEDEEEGRDAALPGSGMLPYVAVGCIPCVGVMALNKKKEVKTLHAAGDTFASEDAAKQASHIGFLGVVFGAMIWMVVFGLFIKPLLEGEPPCDNYPDCVPDEWAARTLAGNPPE
jgi:hypothetical protein